VRAVNDFQGPSRVVDGIKSMTKTNDNTIRTRGGPTRAITDTARTVNPPSPHRLAAFGPWHRRAPSRFSDSLPNRRRRVRVALRRLARIARVGWVPARFHRLDPIAGREPMFEHGDLIPLQIGAFAFRHTQQFPQAISRIAVLFRESRVSHPASTRCSLGHRHRSQK
jgi:hypothetical protein